MQEERDEISEALRTIGLLNSMVNSGEKHSIQSEAQVNVGLAALRDLRKQTILVKTVKDKINVLQIVYRIALSIDDLNNVSRLRQEIANYKSLLP